MATSSPWTVGQQLPQNADGTYGQGVGYGQAASTGVGYQQPGFGAQSTGQVQTSWYPAQDPYAVLAGGYGTPQGGGYSSYPGGTASATGSQDQTIGGGWQTNPSAWMENAFNTTGGNYLGGTNSQSYYDQTSPGLTGPTAMSSLYNSMSGMGPTASSQALASTAASLGGPGNSQQAFDQIGGSYLSPSASSQVLAGAAGQLGGPGASQQYYEQNAGQYGAPTAIGQLAASNPYSQTLGSEALGRNAQAMYGDSTYSQNNLGNAMGVANSQSDLAAHQGDISGLYNGANYVQGFQGANQSQLSGPGALEQFAASDLNRTNPYYDMLQKQQSDTIDQAAAARGAYGAGGSLAAQALGSANLRAQQYQQEGQLQGSAQQAQLSRLGLGANVAGAASNERMGQGNALSSLYQSMFGDRIQGAQLGLQATGQADTANMQRLAGIQGMTQAGDNATLARLSGQTGLASDASTSALNYLNSGMNAAGQADSSLLARTGLLGSLAGQSDQQRLASLSGYGNLAGQADSSQLGRAGLIGSLAGQTDAANQNFLNSQIGAAGQVDNNQLARMALGSQMSGQADSQNLNWLNSYFNQANQAQGAGQTRIDNEMSQLFNSAALQAGLYSNFYGAGGQQSVEAGTGAVNAGVNGVGTANAANQQGNKNILSALAGIFG